MELKPWQKIGLSVLTVGVTITAIGLTISHIRKRMAANASLAPTDAISDAEVKELASKWWAKDPPPADHSGLDDVPRYEANVRAMKLTKAESEHFKKLLGTEKESTWSADDKLFMNNLLSRSRTNRMKEKERLNTIDKHASSKLLKK